jgi:hypothetical protein
MDCWSKDHENIGGSSEVVSAKGRPVCVFRISSYGGGGDWICDG